MDECKRLRTCVLFVGYVGKFHGVSYQVEVKTARVEAPVWWYSMRTEEHKDQAAKPSDIPSCLPSFSRGGEMTVNALRIGRLELTDGQSATPVLE